MLFLICASSTAFSYTGEAGPPMLKMTVGSRALGLGGAFVGVSDDAYYMDSNPAGGDPRKITSLSILHQEWIQDVNYEALRFSRGFQDRFFGGLGFTYLYLPFTYYDLYGNEGGSASISQALGVLNFGFLMQRVNLAVGSNLKFMYNNVPSSLLEARYGSSYENQNYLIWALDFGAIARTGLLKAYVGPEPSLSMGASLKNIGFSRAFDKLPIELHTGASYRLTRHLLFSGEFALPLFEPVYGAVGAEYDLKKTLFIEGGVQLKANPIFAIGVSYRKNDLEVSVSYTPSIAFYNMVSVSVSAALGKTKADTRAQKIEEMLLSALEHFQKREYEEALSALDKVLELDRGNERAESLKKIIMEEMELEKMADGASFEGP